MAQLHRYGSTDPIYFKLVNTGGDGVTGVTFAAGEVQLGLDGGAASNIGTECSETTFGNGWYQWTPSLASQTQCKTGKINIKDSSSPGSYIENGVVFITGGNANAQYDGA